MEVHHRGIWYAGELLGWRHEPDGRCLARVRCVVDGLRHSTWKDLAELRLPSRTAPATAPPPQVSWMQARARQAPRPGEPADATQPHLLLAGLRSRPHPPARALVPPAPRRAEAAPEPAWRRGRLSRV